MGLSGLTIEPSSLLKDGSIIWLQGREVIDVWPEAFVHAGGKVAMLREPPREATGIIVSADDYERITGEQGVV